MEKEGLQTILSLTNLKHPFSLILSNLVEGLRRLNVRNIIFSIIHSCWVLFRNTGWRTKCHTIDCTHNTFLLLQKHLTSGTELILIGWKIFPKEVHVRCDYRFASQPLANEPLHSSQLFGTRLQKARGTTSLCGPRAALHFLAYFWSTFSFKKLHKKKSHGLISGL